jgi:hypothetical protein
MRKKILEFKRIHESKHGRLEKLDKFEELLNNIHLDTKIAKAINHRKFLVLLVQALIGIVMIILGLAMIILPSPIYFEMFTIFYFNNNQDGFTLMDLISLVIILTGTLLLVISLIKLLKKP